MGSCCTLRNVRSENKSTHIDIEITPSEKEITNYKAIKDYVILDKSDVISEFDSPFPKSPKRINTSLDIHSLNLKKLYNKSGKRLTQNFLFKNENKNLPKRDTTSSTVQLEDGLTKDQEDFIKEVLIENKIISTFDDDTIQEFIIGFFSFQVEQGFILYSEQDEAKLFYIIEGGGVKLAKGDMTRDCITGDCFGEDSFEENEIRCETAIAVEKTKLLTVSGEFYRSAQAYMKLKNIDEKMSFLKIIPLFSNRLLEQNRLISLSKMLVPRTYNPYSILVTENAQFDRVYIIKKGTIRVSKNLKLFKKLQSGEFFGDIPVIIKTSSYYTYSADADTLSVFELFYKDIKELLGGFYIKDMIYKMFINAITKSERMCQVLFQNIDDLFNIFKIKYYNNGSVIFPIEALKNKKICVVLSGKLKKQQKNEIVAFPENLFGDQIIDSKQNLDHNIICEDECLLLEASWNDIVQASESENNIDLSETVQRLKKIPIFSKLKETQFLELSRVINRETYKDGEEISKEGAIADKFYIIKSGKVKMSKKGKFFREMEAGGCFGEIPSITGEIRLFTAVSSGPTECYVLHKDDISSFGSSLSSQIKQHLSLQDVDVALTDLYLVKTLGNGRFGKVYLVHNQKNFYAIKYAVIKTIFKSHNLLPYYINEKNIMMQTDHPFIIKLVKTLKNSNFIFFLLEYIDGVPLKAYLEKKKKAPKSTDEAQFYGGIVLSVIYYLHNKKILHRDIKPDNCMIDKNGYLKLIDFGVSKILKDKDSTMTVCGTPHYLAPEVIMGTGYSFSSDYWALGVTMFEIFYGYVPFGQSCKDIMGVYNEILNKKLKLPYEPKFSEINSFFQIILSKNSIQRMCNFQLLRSHPFFHEFDFDLLYQFGVKAPYIPESFLETSSNSNVSVISICCQPFLNYLEADHANELEGNIYVEQRGKDRKYLDDF